MNWKSFWDNQALSSDPYTQVARIGGQGRHSDELLKSIADHIVNVLGIESRDKLLDVCCGNGLLTSRLAPHCAKITGVDFSENLVKEARKDHPGISFFCADAMAPGLAAVAGNEFTKICLYFSFQYFETPVAGKKVIENLLACIPEGGQILLGDIPDRTHFFKYYHSPGRLVQLAKQMLLNKNDMGKFWSEEELDVICDKLGVKGCRLSQPKHLPYAHYRMDYLITK